MGLGTCVKIWGKAAGCEEDILAQQYIYGNMP